jgi:hypothetical protein
MSQFVRGRTFDKILRQGHCAASLFFPSCLANQLKKSSTRANGRVLRLREVWRGINQSLYFGVVDRHAFMTVSRPERTPLASQRLTRRLSAIPMSRKYYLPQMHSYVAGERIAFASALNLRSRAGSARSCCSSPTASASSALTVACAARASQASAFTGVHRGHNPQRCPIHERVRD